MNLEPLYRKIIVLGICHMKDLCIITSKQGSEFEHIEFAVNLSEQNILSVFFLIQYQRNPSQSSSLYIVYRYTQDLRCHLKRGMTYCQTSQIRY